MLQTLINPIIIGITISTAFGVVIYDTQLDKAATLAIVPAALMAYVVTDTKSDVAHIHVERSSSQKLNVLRSAPPRTHPRDDARNYLLNKAGYTGGLDTTRLWPSV